MVTTLLYIYCKWVYTSSQYCSTHQQQTQLWQQASREQGLALSSWRMLKKRKQCDYNCWIGSIWLTITVFKTIKVKRTMKRDLNTESTATTWGVVNAQNLKAWNAAWITSYQRGCVHVHVISNSHSEKLEFLCEALGIVDLWAARNT